MIRAKKLLLGVLLVATLVGVAGCSDGGRALDNTRWKLTGWSVSSLDPSNFEITADFKDGKIAGKSAVNSYSGPYKTGPQNSFGAGPLSGTLMAGEEAAMRAESMYTTLLGQASSYRYSSTTLTLFDANGNESLIFENAGK